MPTTLQRLVRSVRHLEQAYDAGHVDLALAASKRVQRESRLITQELAIKRDNATAQEAQAHDD